MSTKVEARWGVAGAGNAQVIGCSFGPLREQARSHIRS
ncbi:hypothetical protein AK973_4672 [Pseudomonas brassicacearum]|nr:hypothetical protein AK973_4672 [Pseudomonas brassicacearum]